MQFITCTEEYTAVYRCYFHKSGYVREFNPLIQQVIFLIIKSVDVFLGNRKKYWAAYRKAVRW